MGEVATLKEEELFPPDPEVWGIEAPDAELHEFDKIEGLDMQMMQALNHYQQKEQRCFMCGITDHFAWDCPNRETYHA